MKKLFVLLCVLSFYNCKKDFAVSENSLRQSVKAGNPFNVWVLDHHNAANNKITQESEVYKNKINPVITLNKDYTYQIDYTPDTGKVVVSEFGTFNFLYDKGSIVFYPSSGSAYSFGIYKTNEESFVFMHFLKNKMYTTSDSQGPNEKLYFSDID